MLRRALIAAAFIVVASCGSNSAPPSSGPSPAVPPQGGGILFIGNSLTTTNDLPAMIEQLARESGGTPIVTRTIAEGGFSLEDMGPTDFTRLRPAPISRRSSSTSRSRGGR
jgi:hypothetical protein